MEVKPGYKQTEVGVIPEEWVTSRLQDIVDRNAPIAYGVLKPGDYVHNGTPLLQIRDVIHGDIDVEQLHRISEQLDRQYLRTRLAGGEIVVSLVGTIGKVALIPATFAGGNLHRNLARVHVSEKHDPKFIFYFLNSHPAQATIKLTTFGSTQALLNLADLRRLMVVVPRLPEQRAIAVALSDVDTLLDAMGRLVAKKRDLKQAAMQQLLTGHTRLHGFTGEWEVKRVEQLGQIVTGGTPRTDIREFWGEGYPWVTPTDISSDRDMFESERSLTLRGLSTIRALPANTVLVTCIASIGKNAILKSQGGCNQQINAVIPHNNSAEFLYYLFEFSKQYLLANAGSTATSIVSKAAFSELEFRVPLLSEQTAIANVLSDMDAELAALEQRLAKTRALKQGMMQELLTGKTRLVSPEVIHA